MTARAARRTALGVLAVDAAALVLVVTVAAARPDRPAPDTRPDWGTVVQTECIGGRITEVVDDGNPDGVLPITTGRPC